VNEIVGDPLAEHDHQPAALGLETFDALTAALNAPGRRLIFCDDTSLQGRVAEHMEPDVELMCAVCLPSDAYPSVGQVLAHRLEALGVGEFHAKEVVNPNSSSVWLKVSIQDRIETFRFMSQWLRNHVDQAGYLFIAKSDFEQMKVVAGGPVALGIGQKSGLRKVTLSCVAEQFASAQLPTLLVVDQAKPANKPQLTMPHAGLVGGGAIVADSAKIAGLQLADMAAYCIGRYLRKRAALRTGQGGPFDQIALETMADFQGRLRFLLAPDGASPAS